MKWQLFENALTVCGVKLTLTNNTTRTVTYLLILSVQFPGLGYGWVSFGRIPHSWDRCAFDCSRRWWILRWIPASLRHRFPPLPPVLLPVSPDSFSSPLFSSLRQWDFWPRKAAASCPKGKCQKLLYKTNRCLLQFLGSRISIVGLMGCH